MEVENSDTMTAVAYIDTLTSFDTVIEEIVEKFMELTNSQDIHDLVEAIDDFVSINRHDKFAYKKLDTPSRGRPLKKLTTVVFRDKYKTQRVLITRKRER